MRIKYTKKRRQLERDVQAIAEAQRGEREDWEVKFDEFYDDMEHEIMGNVYELIQINFDSIILADATQIIPMRERLKELVRENREEIWKTKK